MRSARVRGGRRRTSAASSCTRGSTRIAPRTLATRRSRRTHIVRSAARAGAAVRPLSVDGSRRSAEVRRRTLRAIVDVVKRYDIDGVHIDDYFYPYPETDAAGHTIDFPDAETYAALQEGRRHAGDDDWRRDNVDTLVAALYTRRPRGEAVGEGRHQPVRHLAARQSAADSRASTRTPTIYADSKQWLEKGWVDYFTPQLYWPIRPPEQSFPVLLDWWLSQNTKHRHIWPGLADYRVGEAGANGSRFTSQEIVDQIDTVARARQGRGRPHPFQHDGADEGARTASPRRWRRRYREPALVPASPWLGAKPPARPTATVARDPETGDLLLRMTAAAGADARVWLWTVRSLSKGVWTSEVLPGWLKMHRLPDAATGRVIVTAVSRTGVESAEVAVDVGTKARHRRENRARRPVGELRRVVPRVDWSGRRSHDRRQAIARRQFTARPRVAMRRLVLFARSIRGHRDADRRAAAHRSGHVRRSPAGTRRQPTGARSASRGPRLDVARRRRLGARARAVREQGSQGPARLRAADLRPRHRQQAPHGQRLRGEGAGQLRVSEDQVQEPRRRPRDSGVPLLADQRRKPTKHAALVWVHGGVHGDWDTRLYPFVVEAVQRGYVILTPDYRGSTGYGDELHRRRSTTAARRSTTCCRRSTISRRSRTSTRSGWASWAGATAGSSRRTSSSATTIRSRPARRSCR